MLTMKEIRSKNYKIFPPNMPEDTIQRQESSLKYIEHLGSLTNTDVSQWKPLTIFADDKGQLPVVRNKINELFFSWVERNKQNPEKLTPKTLTEKEAEGICFKFDQYFAKHIDKAIENQCRGVRETESAIQSYYKEVMQRQELLFKQKATIAGLEEKKKRGTGVSEDLNQILTEGWWTISESPEAGAISLVTPFIRISHLREKAAIAVVANLGHIQLNIRTNGSALQLTCHTYDQNALFKDAWFHPHVEPSGLICFGNMGPAVTTAQQTFNLIDCCEIVKKVLTNYYDGNPYVRLHEFEEAVKQGRIFCRVDHLKKEKALREVFAKNRFTPPLPPDIAATQAQQVIVDNPLYDDDMDEEENEDNAYENF